MISKAQKIAERAQTTAFMQTLPQLETLADNKTAEEATKTMNEMLEAQATLDSGVELSYRMAHDLSHVVMRGRLALEALQDKLGVDGFRSGNIAFSVIHRVSEGKHDFERNLEVLQEEK